MAIATLCENVLLEKTGVASIVRAIDTYHLNEFPDAAPKGFQPVLQVKGFLSLKSGPVTGEHEIGLVFENPLGERTPVSTSRVVFEGNEHGVNAEIGLPILVKNFGLCWFDVLFDGDVITRIPLRLNPPAVPKSAE